MSCPKLVESGVYVLGALPPGQRLDYERHLSTCAECRTEVGDLAVLPGLLGRLDQASVAALTEGDIAPPTLPPTMLPVALGRMRRGRRTRRYAAFAGALAAACAALVIGLTIPPNASGVLANGGPTPSATDSNPAPVTHAMTSVGGQSEITAQVALVATKGGTRVDVSCTYLGTGASESPVPPWFSIYVYPSSGGPAQEIGTWSARPGETTPVPGMTSWPIGRLSRVELRAQDGTPLLRYNVG